MSYQRHRHPVILMEILVQSPEDRSVFPIKTLTTPGKYIKLQANLLRFKLYQIKPPVGDLESFQVSPDIYYRYLFPWPFFEQANTIN